MVSMTKSAAAAVADSVSAPFCHIDNLESISALISATAERLRNPAVLPDIVASATRMTTLRKSSPWRPHSVADGYAGMTLLWGYLDECFPEQGWDCVARD